MKPRFALLNLLLAVAVLAVGWQVRVRWVDAQSLRKANLNVPVRKVTPPPLSPAPKPDAVPATKYADVAEKDLFAKDRNPVVVLDPPVIEKPKPKPALPVVYGVMGLPSGVRAIMSGKPGEGPRSVKAGEDIGEFKVLSLDTKSITLEWDGKPETHRIDELIDRSNPEAARAGGGIPNAASSSVSSGPAAPAPVQQMNAAPPAKAGVDTGGVRVCTPGENSAPGTVVDGYRKTVTQSIFGPVCRWVPASQ